MPDRDTYRSDPSRWSRPRDNGAPRRGGSDYGWSSASEGRSFADRDAGAPYGSRYGRGGDRYGGQGSYGQGPGPGDDLRQDGVRLGHAPSRSSSRLDAVSTVAVQPGGTTVVVSICSMMAGPAIRVAWLKPPRQ